MALQHQLKAGRYYLYDMSMVVRRASVPGTPPPAADCGLRAAGAQDSANDIVVVSGPLPVNEISKCLQISGYCRRLFTLLATLPHGKRLAHQRATF